MSFTPRIRRIALLLLFWATSPALIAQNPLPTNTDAVYYIVFLHERALAAQNRSAAGRHARPSDDAARLHIVASEISLIDNAALTFVAEERALRQEALDYHKSCSAAHRPVDPAIIHSFAVRRAGLAAAAMATLNSKLSPQSALGLQSFVESGVKRSVVTWR